jgi:heptosyltransferase-2
LTGDDRAATQPGTPGDCTRILIVQTSFLGDVVLSTPVFAAVRRHHPAAHVSVLVRPECAGVLHGHPAVDAVLVDDKRGRDRGVGALRTVRRLRHGRFDLALSLHKSLRTACVLAAAGIPRRVGFRQSAGWFLYHRTVSRDRTRHDVERNLALLAGIGIDPASDVSRPYVACSPEAGERVRRLLADRGVAVDQPLVGVAPGSAWATKRWTVEGYGALVRMLRDEMHVIPVLLGARADMEYAAAIQRVAGDTAVDLVGQTDLEVLVAAIDRCRVLVSNDSAPMHIAVARDVPVVAVFGPTTRRQGYGPYTERAIVVERDLACRPCSRHGGARCPIGTHACMREITPQEVARAVATMLDLDRSASGAAVPRGSA